MSRMKVAHLGALVFAICLSAQLAASSNSTDPGGNSTSSPNTTMATYPYSSSANSTTGAGVSLHPDPLSLLIPIAMAASLLQRYC